MRKNKTIRPNDDILLLHTNPLTADRSVSRLERIDNFCRIHMIEYNHTRFTVQVSTYIYLI
jgi:hypothetical protein